MEYQLIITDRAESTWCSVITQSWYDLLANYSFEQATNKSQLFNNYLCIIYVEL